MGIKYDENTKLWTNPDNKQLNIVNVSNSDWIWVKLKEHGSKIAQISNDTGAQMTFSELRLKAIRAAQNLQAIGFRPHQNFCFMSIHNENLLPIVLASIGLACPIVPLYPLLSTDEIVRILTKIKSPIIFCDANLYNELNDALNKLQFKMKVFLLDDVRFDGVESVVNLFRETGHENSFVPVKYDLENDPVCIMSSSGTTGPSKSKRMIVVLNKIEILQNLMMKFELRKQPGVCVSYGNHAFLPIELDTQRLVDDCVLFSCDAIYWSVGFKPIMNSIYHGVLRIISSKPFTPELQLKIIEKYKVTVLFNTPSIMAACLKSDFIRTLDFSCVKRIIFYGSKVPNTLFADIKQYFSNADLLIMYGLTEVGLISQNFVNPHAQIEDQAHTNNINGGQLFEGCTVKIVDDSGNRYGPNNNGEICINTKYQFINYFDDPAATAAAIDSEGFFQTGDIGHFDNNGRLFVEDRKKYVANVYYFENILVPSTIEECLIKLPGVLDVCVVGIPFACDECLPAAAVLRKPNSTLDRHAVFNAVAENFPNGLKLRGGTYFLDELPKTHSGKFIRKEITDTVQKLFHAMKDSDPLIQSYLSDIPDDYKRLI